MAGKKGRPANSYVRKEGKLYNMNSLQFKAYLGEIADGNRPSIKNFGKVVEISDPVNGDELDQTAAKQILDRILKSEDSESDDE